MPGQSTLSLIRIRALRFVAVTGGLLIMSAAITLSPSGGIEMSDAFAWISALLLGNAALIFGMFYRLRDSGRAPLVAGVLGCCIALLVLNLDRGLAPNFLIVVLVLGVALAPLLANAALGLFGKPRRK